MDRHRLVSLLLLLSSLAALAFASDLESLITLGAGMFVSLTLVWYPEEFGSLTGIGGVVTQTSPGPLVRFFGWLFLLAGALASFGTAFFGPAGAA